MLNVLLDAGHGGVIKGHYFTPGKRSPGKRTSGDPGIFEGEFNREVCDWIGEIWGADESFALIDYVECITPGPIQIPLRDRVNFVNMFCKKETNTILLSVHANAAGDGSSWNKANGFTIFTCKHASSNSKRLAKSIEKHMRIEPTLEIKSRGVKQANFSIIKRTKCPAVLIECGFMTNKAEAALLAMPSVQGIIAQAIYAGVREYANG